MNAIPMSRPLPAKTPVQQTPPHHDARALIGDGVQARIDLDGKTYWLRITRAGKLILTK